MMDARASFVSALVVAAFASCSTSGPTQAKPPSLTHETLSSVRDAFNNRIDRPRAIIFFSSGCAACNTGSAALQAMLEGLPSPVAVFAIWEPIMDADPEPTDRMLGNLKDSRVLQLWDPTHIMSNEMRAAERANPGSPSQARTRTNSDPDGIMYDTLVVFAPGARWATTLPVADYLEVGLEAKLDDLRGQLERLAKRP
jgi:hypothetical protein